MKWFPNKMKAQCSAGLFLLMVAVTGPVSGTLSLEGDSDESARQVLIGSGSTGEAAQLVTHPQSLSATGSQGQSPALPLAVSNAGDEEPDWSIETGSRGASGVRGDLQQFDDLDSFQDATGDLAFEDFEDGPIGPGQIQGCSGALNSETNDACFTPGDLIEGFSATASSGVMVVVGQGALDAPSTAIIASNGGARTLVALAPAVDAVAVELYRSEGSGALTVTLFDEAGDQLGTGSVTIPGPGQAGFIGFISPTPIARIETEVGEGGGFALIGKLYFGEAAMGEPGLAFDPGSLDFGEVEVGTTSAPQTLVLSNTGEADVTGLSFNAPGNGYDADTGDCDDTLPVGESCHVSVTFTPAGPGPANTTLEADSNEGVGASLALTGNGIEPPPEPGVLSVQPAALDFGPVEVGQTEALTVTVANTAEPGSEALTLDALGLDGGESTEPTTVLATIKPDGNQFPVGNEIASPPNFSADGRFVVFAARPCGSCGQRVYRRDLVAESTELVSVDSDGGEISGRDPQISADGRYVVFRGGGCGRDFCRRDMDAGVNEPIVLPTTDGEPPNSSLFKLAASADARFIAFDSNATNLLPGGVGGVYVYDTDTGILERVSEPFEGFAGDGSSRSPALSADGRYVVFKSTSSNLVPDDTNGPGGSLEGSDIFVHDRTTGTTERVSVASDGSEGNGGSGTGGNIGNPSISADGRYVAFMSEASNLVPDDTNNMPDVFVHDREAGTTERVSLASDGSEGEWAVAASISADGRFVAFYGGALLVPDDTNGRPDTFIHDRDTGTTERVSVAPDGSQILFADFQNAINADGRFVLFRSHDPNVVVPGTNGEHHLYVRDRGFVAITPFTITGGDCAVTTVLEPGESCTVEITFSPDSTGFFEDVLNVETTDAQSQAVPLQGSGGELEDQIFHHRFEDGGAP